jgi:tellurite resistance protein TehA-like permease
MRRKIFKILQIITGIIVLVIILPFLVTLAVYFPSLANEWPSQVTLLFFSVIRSAVIVCVTCLPVRKETLWTINVTRIVVVFAGERQNVKLLRTCRRI